MEIDEIRQFHMRLIGLLLAYEIIFDIVDVNPSTFIKSNSTLTERTPVVSRKFFYEQSHRFKKSAFNMLQSIECLIRLSDGTVSRILRFFSALSKR